MKPNKTIAIIGGGVSGALTAYHLVRRGAQAKVMLIDPHTDLGLGLAYSTPSYRHLLNVPAGKISALPDQPNHFLDWLHKNYDASMTEAEFAPRKVFGRYIQSLLKTVPNLDHRQTAVLDCHVAGEQAILDLADGTKIVADAVVLATGNFDPAPLRGVAEETVSNGSYCHSAWKHSTYANLSPDGAVALIGSGLTAVDVVLRLRELGHQGQIADQIEAELEAGTLILHRASLQAVVASGDAARVLFQTNRGAVKEVTVARVINCTGPNMNYRLVGSPLLSSLFAQGSIVGGPHGAGLWTSETGATRDQHGSYSNVLFHVGPGRQGTLLESIAVPELRQQAVGMAELLAGKFAAHVQERVPSTLPADALLTTSAAVGYELAS